MQMIATYDANGRYTALGSAGGGFPPAGESYHVGIVDIETHFHDFDTNRPAPMPVRPSEAHDFDYTTKLWVLNVERAWAVIRLKRDRLLKETDWLVTKAMETGTAVPAPWVAYRQALRDITSQTDPVALAWPTSP